jgi:rhamnogalacturonan acetylesterase
MQPHHPRVLGRTLRLTPISLGLLALLGSSLGLASLGVAAEQTVPANPPARSGQPPAGPRAGLPPFPVPGNKHASFKEGLPTFWIVGDSTAKNGRDDGSEGGRWGWGHEIDRYFDLGKINVENQALGGTSSRDFITRGHWEKVLAQVQPGDFVVIQFGANDGGGKIDDQRARKSIDGNGDEAQHVKLTTGKEEDVHSYGWYIRKYIQDTQAKGATAIVCSLIPRDDWKDGKIVSAQDDSYVLWAGQAAQQAGAFYINMNHIICDQLNVIGEKLTKGTLYRADDHTHTTLLGAQLNARCVVMGVKGLAPGLKLGGFLAITAEPVDPAPAENIAAGKLVP